MITFQDVHTIQARHLKAFDLAHERAGYGASTIMVNNAWREVLDIWADGDKPGEIFGEDSEVAREIEQAIDWDSPCYVVVRYVDEGASDKNHIADGLHRFRTCDLVRVQLPVQMDIPPVAQVAPAGGQAPDDEEATQEPPGGPAVGDQEKAQVQG